MSSHRIISHKISTSSSSRKVVVDCERERILDEPHALLSLLGRVERVMLYCVRRVFFVMTSKALYLSRVVPRLWHRHEIGRAAVEVWTTTCIAEFWQNHRGQLHRTDQSGQFTAHGGGQIPVLPPWRSRPNPTPHEGRTSHHGPRESVGWYGSRSRYALSSFCH